MLFLESDERVAAQAGPGEDEDRGERNDERGVVEQQEAEGVALAAAEHELDRRQIHLAGAGEFQQRDDVPGGEGRDDEIPRAGTGADNGADLVFEETGELQRHVAEPAVVGETRVAKADDGDVGGMPLQVYPLSAEAHHAAVRKKRFGRPRENCHFSTMSLAEIKAELKTMNRAERLTLVEYVEILNRLDDANVREEVSAAMRRMDSGRKIAEEEVLDTHRRLLAEGR